MTPLSGGARACLALGVVDATAFALLDGHPRAQAVPFVLAPLVTFVLVSRTVRDRGSQYGGLGGPLVAGAGLSLLGQLLRTGIVPRSTVVSALTELALLGSYAGYGLLLARWSVRALTLDARGHLDAFIIAFGFSPMLWLALLHDPHVRGGSHTLLLITLPAAALVLGALALRLFLIVGTRTRLHALVFGWLLLDLGGTFEFAHQQLERRFRFGDGTWQCVWVLSSACLAAFVVHAGTLTTSGRTVARAPGSRVRLPALGAAVFVPSLALLPHQRLSLDLYTLAVSAVVIVLLLVRLSALMVSLSEQRRRHQVLEALSSELEKQARTDPVTGLANRAALNAALDQALAQRPLAADRGCGLVLMDLDGFKELNDQLGHEAGDHLLVWVAQQLRSTCRSSDLVCRLGGDEFALLVHDADMSDLVRLADRVLEALRRPVPVGSFRARTASSIGIALSTDAQTRDELLVQADSAMYAAKERGGNQAAVFDPQRHAASLSRHALERDLRQALDLGQLHVLYQPIIDLKTGEVSGVEALVRWDHPVHGPISPAEFIPMAESTGSISAIGAWVLREACLQLRRWDDECPELRPLRMAVNLSRRQLDSDLPDLVRTTLADTGIPAPRLLLEVTETALAAAGQDLAPQLHALRSLGCRIAVDDFGTGYSALAELRRLPVDVLKIDRSFVAGIAQSPEELALTTAIVRLAASLGKTTVAEGVESGAQLAHLLTLGCHSAQGWLFARAMSAPELTDFRRGQQLFVPTAPV